ncbi:hypothetical protein C8R46DRAFT_1230456 [Mycena filopes]|nr:hypothetical protein C8R46DRAFT_1230456 [Mycena filopes]
MYHWSPISSCLVSVVSVFSFVLSSIHLGNTSDKDQLSAGSTPSRASGNPSLTVISQAKPGLALSAFLDVSIANPLQILLPPQTKMTSKSKTMATSLRMTASRMATAGGDDDPQEDGGVEGGENGGTDDGLATAAAPAPEDPPPPAGGIEEDEDRFRRAFVEDGGRETKVKGRLADVQKSATIPGLLRRLPAVNDLQCDAFLQRASAYYPPAIQLAFAFDPDIPSVVRQTVDRASAFGSQNVSTPAKLLRFFSWRIYLLLVGLPGLGFLIALLVLLGPLQAGPPPGAIVHREEEVVPQADDNDDDDPLRFPTPPTTPRRHRPPPAPHPSPISPPRQRPIAPLPFRDAKTQETCDRMVALLKTRTAGREQNRRDRDDAGERERNERIRAVQRRVWGLIVELRREGAWADDEHEDECEDAAVGDEEGFAV